MRNQPKNFQLLLLVIKIVMEMFVINLVGSSPTKAYFLFAAGSFLRIIFLNVKDTESACFVIPFLYKAAAPFYLRVSKRLEAAGNFIKTTFVWNASRPPSSQGYTRRNWHSSGAKRIHFDSFADASSTAGSACNDLHKTLS